MRISDWSSDVCSSDLSGLLSAKVIGYSIEAVAEGASGVGGAVPFAFGAQPMKEGFIFLPIRSVQSLSHRAQLPAYEREGPEHPRQARKSVVEGKSVSVRVDLGGSPPIKKKNQI